MVHDRARTTPCQSTRLLYLELQRGASKGCVPRRDRKSLTTGHHGRNKSLRIRSMLYRRPHSRSGMQSRDIEIVLNLAGVVLQGNSLSCHNLGKLHTEDYRIVVDSGHGRVGGISESSRTSA